MKKKLTMMILFTAITASLIAGCGTKGSGNGNSASQSTGQEDAEDASEFTGTISEVDPFMGEVPSVTAAE